MNVQGDPSTPAAPPPPEPRRDARFRRFVELSVAPIAIYFAAFCALTWPAITRFSTHFLADAGDGRQNLWSLWWVRTALLERGTHFWFTDLLHHPTGVTVLAHSLTWFYGLLAIPLSLVLSEVQVYNTLVVGCAVMTAWTTFLLAHRVSGSWRGSLFAGAAVAFSAYWMAHAEGHLCLMSLWGIPLFLWAWIRFLERPGVARALGASAILLATVGCDWYYPFYAALAGAILFPVYLARHRDAWRAAGGRGIVALAVFIVASLATTGALYLAVYLEHRASPFQQAHQPLEWSLDAGSLVIPGGHWRFAELTRGFWEVLPGNINETSVYVGWCLIIAAGFSAWAHVRGRVRGGVVWMVIGILFGALALGPALHVFGRRHDVPWMPYALLERLVPPFKLSGMPIRMVVMLQLSAAIVAAIGFDRFWRTVLRPWPLRVVFLALFAIETLRDPFPTTAPETPDYVQALASLPHGAVFGLSELDPTGALYHQRVFRKPVNGGYLGRIPLSHVARHDRIKQLFLSGRMAEFFEVSGARYVVRPNVGSLDSAPRGLRPVFVGATRSIFVAEDDPLTPVDAGAPAIRRRMELLGSETRFSMDGAGERHLAYGWYPEERGADGRSFRWTHARAAFDLVARGSASKVCIRALTRPRPARVRVAMNGLPPVEQRQEAGEESVLCFELSRPPLQEELLRFQLETETFAPREIDGGPDERQLGLRIAEIWLE